MQLRSCCKTCSEKTKVLAVWCTGSPAFRWAYRSNWTSFLKSGECDQTNMSRSHLFYQFRNLSLFSMLCVLVAMFASIQSLAQPQGKDRLVKYPTSYRTVQIDRLSIFYREAGPKDAPTLLLLHGLPSSSRMFEPLFARLSDRYHLVAPDYAVAGSKNIRVHVRSLRRDHESLHGGAGIVALHALHAGLRRPGRFSHGPCTP